MAFSHQFKPAHKEIKRYYEELAGYATHEIAHEGATSSAFQNLLAATCKKADWHLVPQLSTRIRGKQVRPDGTDKRNGITSDPNNPDDEEYIVRLVGQVVRVSVETVKIVNGLPAEYTGDKG